MSKTNEANQDGKYDDSQESSFEDTQVFPDGFESGNEPATISQKLIITVKRSKVGTGYEATIPSRPDVKKKTSKVSLELAARELVNSMKVFAWDDWKDVTSLRDQDAGRKTYEYTGEAF